MKLRTVLISVVVSAALVGGAGYGAYYATQSQKSPIEVVPVSNVSQGYWGMDDQQIVYGSVTSQVAQTVQLNDEYGIDKIYVEVGDEVKEGTPLFSYDMTLQELELEMQQLELQTNELTLTRLEKELEKLKKTPATASLERNWFTLTASAEEKNAEPDADEPDADRADDVEPETAEPDAVLEDETEFQTENSFSDGAGVAEQPSGGQDGIEIDDVEKVHSSEVDESDSLLPAIEDSVLSFERLVLEIQATFLACGDELRADDIGEAVEQAVSYYRKNLADEKEKEEVQADGSVKIVCSYVLKDSVRAALDKEEVESLKKRCKTLNEYQIKYVEMLISEAGGLEDAALPEAVQRIEKAYGLLATQQQGRVGNYEKFEELKALAGQLQDGQTGADGADGTDGSGQPQGDDGLTDADLILDDEGQTDADQIPGAEGQTDADQIPDGEGQTDADQIPDDEGQTDAGQIPDGEGQMDIDQVLDGEGQTDPGDEEKDKQSSDAETVEDQNPEENEVGEDVRQNTVTFDVSEGAFTTVKGQDVTNSFAMAENGKIVFDVILEDGYEITEVLVDGSIPARRNEASDDPDDYVIEGIQTNDTIVSVRTQQILGIAAIDEEGISGDGSQTAAPQEETSGDNSQEMTAPQEETSGDNSQETAAPQEETSGDNSQETAAPQEETSGDNGQETAVPQEETSGDNGQETAAPQGETSGEGSQETEAPQEEMSEEDGQEAGESESNGTEHEELPQAEEYIVTINPGSRTEPHEAGRLVPLQADLSDVTLVFMGWSVVPSSGDAEQKVELNAEDVSSGYASFVMPEFDVTATARYENAPDAINSYVATFLSNAEMLLAEDAAQAYEDEGKDFLTELESAIVFYQQWLSDPVSEVLDEAEMEVPEMEEYQLLSNVSKYLKKQGKSFQVKQLKTRYRELCLLYAKSLFEAIDSAAIDKELLEKAVDTYNRLGENWRKKLENRWKEEQANLAEEAGAPWEKNEKGKNIAPEGFLGIGDTLGAYTVMQMFQELQNLPEDVTEDERIDMVLDIWDKYTELSDAQKLLVSSDPYFVETFQMYGLWNEEPETEFPYYDYGDYWDMGYPDDEPMYTAAELAEMIRDKEQEIKSCSLDIRQSELDLKQKQRIIDGKIVKSTMDGTVVSIGGPDGESDEDYFVKVANETGLYAKGTMNELALEKINVGDTVSGTLMTNGASFTAVIKEVSEYPDANGQYMSYGQENTNASYYPFYALIDDTEGLEEGDAEINLSGQTPGDEDGKIYLENYFVRSETDGRTYVYKKGDDDKLTKQYVKTGKNTGWSMEIQEGLTFEDEIAFPYGKDVKEGAKTKSVDQLQDAFM